MIKRVLVQNFLGEMLELSLANPDPLTGIIITGIDGLGPPQADINTTSIATGDGGVFNSARANERNIVLHLQFGLEALVEDARLTTYKYFPIKKNLIFFIETDRRFVMISGFVESNEPDIFQQEETASISIICPDPWFYSVASESGVFSGIRAIFEFPFSNESLEDYLIEFAAIELQITKSLWYYGDVDTGIILNFHALDEVGDIEVYNFETKGFIKISNAKIEEITGSTIQPLDDIIISTVSGDIYAELLRNGEYHNIFNAISRESEWFQIHAGENVFFYKAELGTEKLEFKMTYNIAYEGV